LLPETLKTQTCNEVRSSLVIQFTSDLEYFLNNPFSSYELCKQNLSFSASVIIMQSIKQKLELELGCDLIWKVIFLEFRISKYMVPHPFEWIPATRQLIFNKSVWRSCFPWCCVTFGLVGYLFLLTSGLLVHEIISPYKTLSHIQVIIFVFASITTLTSIISAIIFSYHGDKMVLLIREILILENQLSKGNKNIVLSKLDEHNIRVQHYFMLIDENRSQLQRILGVFVDPTGLIALALVLTFSAAPTIVTIFIITTNMDPTYVLSQYILAYIGHKSPNDKQYQYSLEIPLIICRFVCWFIGGMEICRNLCIGILFCLAALKQFVHTLKKLNERSRQKLHEIQFIFCYLTYTKLVIISVIVCKSFGFLLYVMMGASMIIIVLCGYSTVVLQSVIPLQYYWLFPVGTVLAPVATAQVLTFSIFCYEQSKELLRQWNYTVLGASNRKFMLKKVRAMPMIRFYACAFECNFYFLKQSTITTFFNVVTTHTITSVLLVPLNT
jgi:hypothetical protein